MKTEISVIQAFKWLHSSMPIDIKDFRKRKFCKFLC